MMPRKRARSPRDSVDDGERERRSSGRVQRRSISEEQESSAEEEEDALSQEDFHRLFAAVVFAFGCSVASPAKIANEMVLDTKFPQLKSEHLKSHLQRFRKNLEANKESFLEDYDKFLEVLQVIDEKNQVPGEFGMLDLSTVLGGKAAAMASYDAMHSKGKHGTAAASAASAPHARSVLDNTFVYTTSTQTGMPVTKIPAPKLSEAEKKTPVGVSLLHAIHLLKCLEQCLLQQRGFSQRPLPAQKQQHQRLIPADVTAVSLETTQPQQQRKRYRKQSELPPESAPPSVPPSPTKHSRRSRGTRSSSLDKLCQLVSEMSRRELSRRRRSRKRPNSRCDYAPTDDESSSSDDSAPNPKYQRYLNRPRLGSLGESTVSTRSVSPHLGSLNNVNQDTSTRNDWIFEGVPKPTDLRAGGFLLDMSSSSSSLSSSDTDEDQTASPVRRQLPPSPSSVRERREAFQRKRSTSDVSLIGQDNEDLYVAGDGSIRSSRASSNGDPPSFMPTLPEHKPHHQGLPVSGPDFASAAALPPPPNASEPPSPSATAVMDYMEKNLLDDSGFSSLVLDSNWNESDFMARLSRATSPSHFQLQQHQQLQRRLQPRRNAPTALAQFRATHGTGYQSHAILPSDMYTQPSPIPRPLSQPKLLSPTQPQAAAQNMSYTASTLPPAVPQPPIQNDLQPAVTQQQTQQTESSQGGTSSTNPPQRRESLGMFHPVEAFPEQEEEEDNVNTKGT